MVVQVYLKKFIAPPYVRQLLFKQSIAHLTFDIEQWATVFHIHMID